MRTIIAGSRGITDLGVVADAVEYHQYKYGPITEVVSGTARGVDRLGETWARKYEVNVRKFPADWSKYGRAAGYRRNEQMAEYADTLVAVWDGSSPGTKHMIEIARREGLHVTVWSPKEEA